MKAKSDEVLRYSILDIHLFPYRIIIIIIAISIYSDANLNKKKLALSDGFMIMMREVKIRSALPIIRTIIPARETPNVKLMNKKMRTAAMLANVMKYLVLVKPNLFGIVGTPAIR